MRQDKGELTLKIKFRCFSPKERARAWYFLIQNNKAEIHIDRGDSLEEQLKSIYHEITHFAFDCFQRYKVDGNVVPKKIKDGAQHKVCESISEYAKNKFMEALK